MKELPDRSIDLFLCDLPYGCLSAKGCPWDVKIDINKFWKEIKRLRKNTNSATIMFCTEKFGFELFNSNPNEFRYALIWNKGRGTSFMGVNKMPMRSHECIYIFAPDSPYYKLIKEYKPDAPSRQRHQKQRYSKQYGTINSDNDTPANYRCPLTVLEFKKSEAGRHPTEKRIELYKWLLKRYCPDGGTVLDPTAGSFNSCLASAQLGLTAIGIEKDDKFYNQAEVRFGLRSPDGNEIVAPNNGDY
jgi:DNA modification methylase